MNKEELIGKLQMVYVGDKNALNEMIDYYDELFDEMESWREEVKELKKQLEELEEENFNLRENIYIEKMSFSSEGRNIKELIEMPTYEDLLNQQKEFINYLENESKEIYRDGGLRQNIFKQILQKYKEIIGDVENENK